MVEVKGFCFVYCVVLVVVGRVCIDKEGFKMRVIINGEGYGINGDGEVLIFIIGLISFVFLFCWVIRVVVVVSYNGLKNVIDIDLVSLGFCVFVILSGIGKDLN